MIVIIVTLFVFSFTLGDCMADYAPAPDVHSPSRLFTSGASVKIMLLRDSVNGRKVSFNLSTPKPKGHGRLMVYTMLNSANLNLCRYSFSGTNTSDKVVSHKRTLLLEKFLKEEGYELDEFIRDGGVVSYHFVWVKQILDDGGVLVRYSDPIPIGIACVELQGKTFEAN